MRGSIRAALLLLAAFPPVCAWAQLSVPPPQDTGATRTVYVRLASNANAILVEPVRPDPVRSHIAILVTHPEHQNNFDYFIGPALARYGYRVMLLNYYGREQSYYEFLTPIAQAIRALRSLPGVRKVVLAGHSTGGAELTSYEVVAENGPKACQQAVRISKCDSRGLENLPKADGMMLLDSNSGAPERTISLEPGIDPRHPNRRDPSLNIFNPANGYDPATGAAHYSAAFLRKYFAAQRARADGLIDEALGRLSKIEKGQGDFKDDEPFVVAGVSRYMSAGRPDLTDGLLMSRTRAPHLLLKADGTRPVQIIPLVRTPQGSPRQDDMLFETTENTTVRSYLSFQALRVSPDYRIARDRITGLQWCSTPNSIQCNLAGIRVPTLVMSATCAPHLVLLETAYYRSAARDKTFVGDEGADHGFLPCKPKYGDTFKRAFDYVDGWLLAPGRFLDARRTEPVRASASAP